MTDDPAAIKEARKTAGALIQEAGPTFWDQHEWHLQLVDENQRLILTLSCFISSFEPQTSLS
jgi:hypothetical protein